MEITLQTTAEFAPVGDAKARPRKITRSTWIQTKKLNHERQETEASQANGFSTEGNEEDGGKFWSLRVLRGRTRLYEALRAIPA